MFHNFDKFCKVTHIYPKYLPSNHQLQNPFYGVIHVAHIIHDVPMQKLAYKNVYEQRRVHNSISVSPSPGHTHRQSDR